MKKENVQKIADLLYKEIGYMYCDNCRFNSEIKEEDTDEWGCDECHRKYNGWGISRAESERIATEISSIIRSHMDEEKDDGWISVKKRLPEGKEVIAQNKDCEMLIGYVYYSEEMEWYECESESMYLTNVIAWQPLPKPYKEG